MKKIDSKNHLEGDANDSTIAGNDVNVDHAEGNITKSGGDIVGGNKITNNQTLINLGTPEFIKKHWKATLAILLLPLPVTILWQQHSSNYNEQLQEAQSYMNIGLYAEAGKVYRQAIEQHASAIFQNLSAAKWGLEKTQVYSSRKPRVIESKLKQFAQRHPDDADVHVLHGKLKLTFNELEEAERHYKKAIALNPDAAEAHADLCEIHDKRNELQQAIAECKTAMEIPEISPPNRYRINLAALHLQNGDPAAALVLLNKADNSSVLARFELAKTYQALGELTEAEKRLEKVLKELGNSAITELPENSANWYFKNRTHRIELRSLDDKKCYVNYSLAATLYLHDKQDQAMKQVKQGNDFCGENEEKIKQQLLFDLDSVKKNGLSAKSIEKFNADYLQTI